VDGPTNGVPGNPKTTKVHVGDDPVVKNNPVCQGPVTQENNGAKVTVGCDLVGKYVGVSTLWSYSLAICEIQIASLPL
jgi:hypothetical protein